MINADLPPLLGDENGIYRIKITGNSGSGKSTLGLELSKMLNIPFISLDAIHWQPGWVAMPAEEMEAKITESLDESQSGWVVDGDYLRKGGRIAEERATDIIWLDPPLALYFPRLVKRTFLRLFGLRPPCSPGCPETWREAFFSKESIFWWCLSQHWINRRRNSQAMEEIGIIIDENGSIKGKMRRLGGWGTELRVWLEQVENMIRRR